MGSSILVHFVLCLIKACDNLGPGVEEGKLIAHAVRVNVFRSIEFLLNYSEPLRQLVKSGNLKFAKGEFLLVLSIDPNKSKTNHLCFPYFISFVTCPRGFASEGNLEIQGGIYHLETGRVEFLGRAPNQAELLASDCSVPPSVMGLSVRTTTDGPMPHKEALQILKDGNKRYVKGETLSGNVTNGMRTALVKEGQAPLAAIIGCADSRAPLETVFDAMPGDIFVLRNAGNTCTHAEGSVLGSLEFCVGALGTKNLDNSLKGSSPGGGTWGADQIGAYWYEATTLEPLNQCSIDAFEVEVLVERLWERGLSLIYRIPQAVGDPQPRMVMVLGHTACGAIKGATATHLQSKAGNKPQAWLG